VAHQPAISFSIAFLSPFNRAGGRTSNVVQKMSFILSANRDHDSLEELRKNWEDYQSHLTAHKDKFPSSAFEIATSAWWYQFDLPEAPHDSRLVAFRMGDHGAPTWDNQQFSWIEIELHSAYSGTILLRYPKVYRYDMKMAASSKGIHGDWRYDEFALTDEGNLLHTIEWADGALWVIEASDLEHEHVPESGEENQEAQQAETQQPLSAALLT
jgi:hypothetical protein